MAFSSPKRRVNNRKKSKKENSRHINNRQLERKEQTTYSNFVDEYRAIKQRNGGTTSYTEHKKTYCVRGQWEANEIIENFLWLGAITSASSVYKLYELEISYVLNCAEPNAITYDKETFEYMCLNAKDKNRYNIINLHLNEAIAFIEKARLNKAKILIHCIGGVNRSAAIVIGYLLYLQSKVKGNVPSIVDATKVVLDQRPFALANRSFQQQLVEYEQFLNHEIMERKYRNHETSQTMI